MTPRSFWSSGAAAALAAIICQPVVAQTAHAEVPGHYYLSGVMETGSELLIDRQGTFEWYLVVGGLDLFAKGTWRQEGRDVVLEEALPGETATAALDERFPWDEAAERHLIEGMYDHAVADAREQCPFIAANLASVMAPVLMDVGEQAVDRRADAARTLEVARALAEGAMAAAAANLADVALQLAAMDAMQAFDSARGDLEDAWREQGELGPDVTYPAAPPECGMPAPMAEASSDPAGWHRAVAVVAGDPSTGQWLQGATVTFRLSDGTLQDDISDYRGWAAVTVPTGLAVTGVKIATDQADIRFDEPIEPMHQGVQAVRVDLASLHDPVFGIMRLAITPDGLLPDLFGGNGIYRKGARE